MAQIAVYAVRPGGLFLLIEQTFLHHRFDIVILFIDDLLAVVLIHDVVHIHRMVFGHHLVILQKLDRMPAQVIHLAVMRL